MTIEGVHICSEEWNNVHDEMDDEMKHGQYDGLEHNLNCFAERIDCDELMREMPRADGTAGLEAEREIEIGCHERAMAQRSALVSQHFP